MIQKRELGLDIWEKRLQYHHSEAVDEVVPEPSAVVPGHLFFPCAGVVTSYVSGHNEKYLILAFAQSMGYSLKGDSQTKMAFSFKNTFKHFI